MREGARHRGRPPRRAAGRSAPPARRRAVRAGHDIDELVEQLAARAGGNAFFIQELLDTLIERGILVADTEDGEWPRLLRWVKRDAPIHVPSTVEDLLLTRIDGLPLDDKDTLIHAAVLGRCVRCGDATSRLRNCADPSCREQLVVCEQEDRILCGAHAA